MVRDKEGMIGTTDNARGIKGKVLTLADKQRESLDTLKNLRAFCEKENITYFLAYGTLLGAVRHKGFIPWDDDVDVMIPRPDYERLLSAYRDETERFRLISCFTDNNYNLPYAKLDNLQTARLKKDGAPDSRGIGIDLFPLDGIPGDIRAAEKMFKRQNHKFLNLINRFSTYSLMPADSTANMIRLLAGKAVLFTGFVNKTARQIGRKMYTEDYDDCPVVACVTGIHSGRFIPFDREWFNSKKMEFEGELFNCPCGYDEVLKKIYGDYMVIPPEADRRSTHTEVFVWR